MKDGGAAHDHGPPRRAQLRTHTEEPLLLNGPAERQGGDTVGANRLPPSFFEVSAVVVGPSFLGTGTTARHASLLLIER